MLKFFPITGWRQRPQSAFTLEELILVLGIFAFVTALLLQNLFSIYRFKEVIRYKKDLNLEASFVLNNGIAGLIRSGFAIDYDHTRSDTSRYLNEAAKSEGLRANVDQLAIYMDALGVQDNKGGRRYFLIHREAHQKSGPTSDTARLLISFYQGDELIEENPLHSSEMVVEEFDISVPKKPATDLERDIQPYVTLYLRVRHRYPDGDLSQVAELENYQKVLASYQTTYLLRNVSAAY